MRDKWLFKDETTGLVFGLLLSKPRASNGYRFVAVIGGPKRFEDGMEVAVKLLRRSPDKGDGIKVAVAQSSNRLRISVTGVTESGFDRAARRLCQIYAGEKVKRFRRLMG